MYKYQKDEIPNTTSEEAPPLLESRSQVVGLDKERRKATQANWGNKEDEDSKPKKFERTRCSND